MSQFEEDSSLNYLRKAKSNNASFYAKMDRQNNHNNNHSQTQSTTTTSTSMKPNPTATMSLLRKTLGVFYNYSPPSLPRNYLPPQSFTDGVSNKFETLRNRVLEIRMELLKLNEVEKEQRIANEQNEDDTIQQPTLNRKERRRREREEMMKKREVEAQNGGANVPEPENDGKNQQQLNNKQKDQEASPAVKQQQQREEKEREEQERIQKELILLKGLPLVQATARSFFIRKQSLDLFEQGIVPRKDFDRKKWIEFLFNSKISHFQRDSEEQELESKVLSSFLSNENNEEQSVPYSSSLFSLTPNSHVSLLARMTPGMSNALIEAICSKFSKIANSRETLRYKKSETEFLEICVEAINLPEFLSSPENSFENSQQDGAATLTPLSSSSSSQKRGKNNPQVVEGLIRFIALLRHSGLACWLYCALCGVELPLSTEVTRCLQETLRICCQSLKTLFDLRQDLMKEIVEEQQQHEANTASENASSKFVLSRIPAPLPIAEVDKEQQQQQNTNDHHPNIEVRIVADGVNFFNAQDARALLTIIVVIGKYFRQSNPALLPL